MTTEKQHGADIQYEERFISFVDILGFKDSISNEKANTLIRVIQLLRAESRKQTICDRKK
jgi:hypothetical protein